MKTFHSCKVYSFFFVLLTILIIFNELRQLKFIVFYFFLLLEHSAYCSASGGTILLNEYKI